MEYAGSQTDEVPAEQPVGSRIGRAKCGDQCGVYSRLEELREDVIKMHVGTPAFAKHGIRAFIRFISISKNLNISKKREKVFSNMGFNSEPILTQHTHHWDEIVHI